VYQPNLLAAQVHAAYPAGVKLTLSIRQNVGSAPLNGTPHPACNTCPFGRPPRRVQPARRKRSAAGENAPLPRSFRLKYAAVENLGKFLGDSPPTLMRIIESNERTAQRRREQGTLNAEESDRIARIARVTQRAVEAFGDKPRRASGSSAQIARFRALHRSACSALMQGPRWCVMSSAVSNTAISTSAVVANYSQALPDAGA